jgi:hypothetical protein
MTPRLVEVAGNEATPVTTASTPDPVWPTAIPPAPAADLPRSDVTDSDPGPDGYFSGLLIVEELPGPTG